MERIYNSRLDPTPTGRPVRGSFYQLAVLDLLQHYDCLPSTYIKAAVFREAPGYCKDVLRLLKQERHIGIPDEAKHHEKVLSRPEIYELLPKGELLLLTHGQHKPRTRPSGFRHQLLASLIKFSLDVAPWEYSGLKLMTEEDMLAHEKCPPATAREANPSHIPLGNFVIKPDAPIFGYQYQAKAHMYFHGFEIDRGTEPLRPGSYQRQSIQGKVRHYRDYIFRGTLQIPLRPLANHHSLYHHQAAATDRHARRGARRMPTRHCPALCLQIRTRLARELPCPDRPHGLRAMGEGWSATARYFANPQGDRRKESMSLDSKLAKARDLIAQRDAIDEELNKLFNELPGRPRGRPRKEAATPAQPQSAVS